MGACSAKEIEADICETAQEVLGRHVILERFPGPTQAEGWWIVGRPDGGVAYWAQVCVLRRGTLLVHGDVPTMLFGHYRDRGVTAEKVVRWIAKANSDYYGEKAAIAMGSSQTCRRADIYLDEVEWQIEQIKEDAEEGLSKHEARMLMMWTKALELLKDGVGLDEVDEHIYKTSGDCELIPDAEVLDSSVIWAHCIVKKLHELLKAEEA